MYVRNIMSQLASLAKKFESFLQSSAPVIESFHPHYQKALWEMMLAGGKRFRPMLCLCVVDSLQPSMLDNALLPALALECIHTYSLIHDDLPCMDNSPLRRGYPTLHTTYNETLALLIGDALNTYAFELLSQAKLAAEVKVSLVYELAHNSGASGMVLGQILDCEFKDTTLPLDKLKLIHSNKTLKLIATSLRFGGLIANTSQKILDDLELLGKELGLFFQVRDDLIDALESQNKAGKATQNDTGKNTYVNLLGLQGAQAQWANLKDSIAAKLLCLPIRLRESLHTLLNPYFETIS